jgi:hypothetical protein
MSVTVRFRFLGFCFCAISLVAAYRRGATESAMVDTAKRFLESLTPEQRAASQFEIRSDERTKWHYYPERGFKQEYGHDRRGITFKEMDPKQRLLAQALLSTGLSQAGLVKAMKVMSLEEIVRIMENDTTGHRDAEKYHFCIFGTPADDGTWAWRVEGHHIALNFTIANGRLVSSSPTFFGANPHEVPEGPHKGMRALEREEDLGMKLMSALEPAQRKQAIFDEIAPYDIITMATVRAKLDGAPKGLPASKMNEGQFAMLMALIGEYANNMPAEVAAARLAVARSTPRDRLFFGWAGEPRRLPPQPVVHGAVTTGNRAEKGNYYRIQAPAFLVEYDNTQNMSNHSHSVWRDFRGDFGLDVLAMHYRTDHHPVLSAAKEGPGGRPFLYAPKRGGF